MTGRDAGSLTRRRALAAGAAVAAGALAGCSGGDGGDESPAVPQEPDYKGWFDGVSNYTNTKDRRGAGETTVDVGVQANNGYLGFGPAAIAVSAGTTVVWDWTGRGGSHNVVSATGVFDSGAAVRGGDPTFRHTFTDPGVFRYVCTPHANIGMKGAVFVSLE